jgi:hypothetical protein
MEDGKPNPLRFQGGVAAPSIKRSRSLAAQMMEWTPPGDLSGIKVPKSTRSFSEETTTGGIREAGYNDCDRFSKVGF